MAFKLPGWFKKYKLTHVFMWLLVMAFSFLTYFNPARSVWSMIANVFVSTGLQTIPFYLAAYVMVPQLVYKRRFVAFVVSFLFLVVFMGLFSLFVTRIVDHLTMGVKPIIPAWSTLGPSINLFIWNSILAAFGSSGLKILSDRFRMEKRLVEVEKEKINTELSFLRSQINPHFLFNVMNTIYFQIEKSNTDARLSVEKLSEMLRYQLYECTSDKIQIHKELLYIQNYVAIQTLRMEKESDIRLLIDTEMKNFLIAPLLILPIVENAFKHVSNFKEAGKNKIHLSVKSPDKNIFLVEAVNTYDQSNGQKHLLQSGGLGITNLQRRLELLYPGRHELNINKEADTFQTILKLQYDD
ncbi:MAG TPA: histidine kinase [Mucilaginibacter sp.]|nr:histidine kinase [Mucilaginibacter sp.]